MKTVITLCVVWLLSSGVIAQDKPTPFQDAVLSSIAEINKNMAEINKNIAVMKTDIAVINTRLNTIEGTLERQNNRMDAFDAKLDGLTYTVATIQAVQKTTNNWLFRAIGILVPILGYLFLRKLRPFDKVKDTYAIQSSGKSEPAGLRPPKRVKARPAA